MKNITISCTNIKKTFQSGDTTIEVLHDIDLTAYESQMIMLMGPSGSGKTTLLSIIGGILEQSSGECLVQNTAINDLNEYDKTNFRGKNIGFLFQHFTLVPTLNALENAAIPLLCQGYSRSESFPKAQKLLEALDLQERLNQKVTHLSGGEQQRVAIARACIHNPKIILCDEPTSFLDIARGKQVMAILENIKKEQLCTIIVVTHDPRILGFADRILYIDDGTITEKTVDTL